MSLDLGAFDVLTFDCYGTLIDWERGLLAAMRADPRAHGADATDERAARALRPSTRPGSRTAPISATARCSRAGSRAWLRDLGVAPTAGELAAFGGSVADWPAFPDSADALARLQARYRLVVITNCDDDLFAASNRRLGVSFADVITAQQAQLLQADHIATSTSPSSGSARRRDGSSTSPRACSTTTCPAKSLGLSTVWVNRRHDRPGSGATPPAEATPDLVVPDMATLADLAGV